MRSEISADCGQAVLDYICMDEEVLKGIGTAQQLQNTVGPAPDELVKLLKQGPAKHLLDHAYEYHRKFDAELASIRRIKELQVRRPASNVHVHVVLVRPRHLGLRPLARSGVGWR
jgi:hypothetical protein